MEKQAAITIVAAQSIQYMPPLWQIDLQGPPLNAESLEWLNTKDWRELQEESPLLGWSPYNTIVEVDTEIEGTWQYLALAQGA